MATDIDISHYNTGTATVAANGTVVTGQGTTWEGSIRRGDMFGTHKGDGIRILSVDSNTQLTLAYPWTGGAQTAEPYEIQRTPYDLGYQKAVEDFLEALQSGNLPVLASLLNIDNITSLANQVGESGTILGFAGPGVIKQIPLSSLILGEMVRVDTIADRAPYDDEPTGFVVFVLDANGGGRSALFWKLSDASGDWSDPAWYTGPVGPASTIELGTVTRVPFGQDPDVTTTPVTGGIELNFDIEEAPNLTFPPVVTVPSDQDASAVVTPIAGGYSVQLSIPRGPTGDIDSVTPFWQDRITNDVDAAAARAGLGATSVGSDVFTAVDAAAARAAIGSLGPNETPDKAYRQGNILGSVSQAGGIPTGAIIERGANANGEYVRLADGTQICWKNSIPASSAPSIASGSVFRNSGDSWTLPAQFAEQASVGLCGGGANNRWVTHNSSGGGSGVNLWMLAATSSSTPTPYYGLYAIGRWF